MKVSSLQGRQSAKPDTQHAISTACEKLASWIEQEKFRGNDPHDALNSPLLHRLSFGNKILGIAFIQFFRRFPVNLRKMLGVKKGYNPKGMGLFLSSYLKRHQLTGDESDRLKAKFLIDWLKSNASEGYSGYCWGYNFDWHSRAAFQPKYTPTVVATSFIANAFLDAYENFSDEEHLKIARSSCDFILNDLNRSYENETFCWSYSPHDNTQIFNATMLGSRLLARVYTFTNETELLDEAERSVRFVINRQNDDGSWVYGALPSQRWIDSFHTGYNLECLYEFMKFSRVNRYQENFEKGLQFYKQNFFLDDFTPKYYHGKIYPIDIHSSAQAIICFVKFGDLDFAKNIAVWTIENMQDKSNFFYYQKRRLYTNKIPYMRWSQAWMMYALTTLMCAPNVARGF